MQQAAFQLCNIFQDANFAWELLNAQIKIQMSNLVDGQTIAYLLQLYMRGVERMNSLADPRQSYFKNKVTSLMTKQTVIKSLKENPMKKKAKHDEVQAKEDPKKKQKSKQKQREKTPKKKKGVKQQQLKQVKQINQLQLQQKRRQLQMRMAYEAQEHGPDSLKKIIAQQDHRQQNISSKISKIINSHEQRLNQRIKARKLKTTTFRARSQINLMQSQLMQPLQNYQTNQEKRPEQFLPFDKIFLSESKKQENVQQNGSKSVIQVRKKYHSVEISRNSQSPQKKARKYTFDETNTGSNLK